MDELGTIFGGVVNAFKLPFSLYGFSLSWWDIMIWGIIASVILWIICEVLKK